MQCHTSLRRNYADKNSKGVLCPFWDIAHPLNFWGRRNYLEKSSSYLSENAPSKTGIAGKGTSPNRRGVNKMELSPEYIDRNMRQFCRKALRTLELTAIAGQRQRRRRADREVTFSALSHAEHNQLSEIDRYFNPDVLFDVMGREVVVQERFLAEALSRLSEQQRNIILLKYFLCWTDRQIGETFQVKGDTIRHQRLAALKLLERLIKEDEANG